MVERARSTFLSGGGRHAVLVAPPVDLPPVMADGRIVQVLNNLFANAATHAPSSSPIRLAAARDEAHVAVSVSDEGSGVAPERLSHLFRRHVGAGDGAIAAGCLRRRTHRRSVRPRSDLSEPRAGLACSLGCYGRGVPRLAPGGVSVLSQRESALSGSASSSSEVYQCACQP